MKWNQSLNKREGICYNFSNNFKVSYFYCMNLEHLQSVCLPIGFPRTASQALAYSLTAHPNVVMTNMHNSVKQWWNDGTPLSIDTFFPGILEMNRKMFANEIKYDREIRHYAIPDQWQGRFERLTVIGDCSPDSSMKTLVKINCKSLKVFTNNIQLPLKFIFLVRNPYDIISSEVIASYWPMPHQEKFGLVMDRFFKNCERMEILLAQVGKMSDQPIFVWHMEDHIENPQQKLAELCEFISIESSESYLDACAKIFYKKTSKSRHFIEWPERYKRLVAETVRKYEFFSRYSWDS